MPAAELVTGLALGLTPVLAPALTLASGLLALGEALRPPLGATLVPPVEAAGEELHPLSPKIPTTSTKLAAKVLIMPI
ncbi:hypothetical protein [Actinoplanes palleronii]|uniref:hypothetical protein n=1 Tax=Actinoplanes palleronii TaxID=113570 RepID=UPI0019438979|nr:hypothetical protein [Actinoplanes palleronii]